MKALDAFNQEKAPVGAFSVIVKADGSFAALVVFRLSDCLARTQENFSSFRSSVVINSGEASPCRCSVLLIAQLRAEACLEFQKIGQVNPSETRENEGWEL